ncbi:hypothetical protein CC1G_02999 [Coprinopsis cinerea okayama7|uniref:Uncharacterized protein n=1 Tax=Coprinopsis cinerea (strain Okayama-7 / 130 / ATCC MYA-4618 / FGSC 9003) TaxID=240176 RepID=A8NS15_COPC7|nr:hypothetical protein CC1G_02999 [Coprinopsis cinerea okayama7\|eukprot:XP_001835911.2 hypothetical protein CC1G_02999 [Coprinopsis cinerea okayama7\
MPTSPPYLTSKPPSSRAGELGDFLIKRPSGDSAVPPDRAADLGELRLLAPEEPAFQAMHPPEKSPTYAKYGAALDWLLLGDTPLTGYPVRREHFGIGMSGSLSVRASGRGGPAVWQGDEWRRKWERRQGTYELGAWKALD